MRMTITRSLARIRSLPPPAPGQFGPQHTAIEVITPGEWEEADPFILLMDDRAHGRLNAGPHPHAGFETVSFLVDGDIPSENSGGGHLAPGDVEWTTTGSGIVHGPETPIDGRFRMLQLWLTLPKADRWTAPDHQLVRRDDAPARHEGGAELRLYSGTSGSLRSATRNRVPVTLVDMRLASGASVTQVLPASHNGFLYPLAGVVTVGSDELAVQQVGWLDRPASDRGDTELVLANRGSEPARVLLYAGERQNTPITWYGPFIGDTRQDIVHSIERYKAGTFVRV
jgi:redox-sensitive bicupin YhaK (pirin superfamily)